jgi:hypothetical protein
VKPAVGLRCDFAELGERRIDKRRQREHIDGMPYIDPPHEDQRAKVFEDRVMPGNWRVECEHEDGATEVAIFSGRTARERAIRYADWLYGDFEEMVLEPYRFPKRS